MPGSTFLYGSISLMNSFHLSFCWMTLTFCVTALLAVSQGLTLAHRSAQRKHLLSDTLGGFSDSVTERRLTLSREVDECKALP